MKPTLGGALRIGAVLAMSAPVAIVLGILAFPFWSWVEATSGIEAVGHSGPAEWCYAVTYALVVLAGLAVFKPWRR